MHRVRFLENVLNPQAHSALCNLHSVTLYKGRDAVLNVRGQYFSMISDKYLIITIYVGPTL